jgi:putative IMPACT (imprinted ancient) family translation regulator
VVVRHFGGTLLGTSGLIQAYRASAQEALQHAEKVEKTLEARFRIHFSYLLMSSVMNAVKKLQLPVLKQEFHLDGSLETAIRLGLVEETLLKLKAAIAGVSEEEAATMPDLEGCDITRI